MNNFITLVLIALFTLSISPTPEDNQLYTGGKLPEIVVPAYVLNEPAQIHRDSTFMYYRDYYQLVADNSPFDVAFIAGYFNLETDYGNPANGKSLWARAYNPTGQVTSKYNKYESGTTRSSDDGGSTKAKYSTLYDSAMGWAWLLSLRRYRGCSKMKRLEDKCYCMYKAGYHTSPRWKKRVNYVREAERKFSKL